MGGHAAQGVVGAGQEVVRESAGDGAGSVEAGQRFGGQVDIEAGEVVCELLRGACAEDRDDAALGAQPREGDDR